MILRRKKPGNASFMAPFSSLSLLVSNIMQTQLLTAKHRSINSFLCSNGGLFNYLLVILSSLMVCMNVLILSIGLFLEYLVSFLAKNGKS